MLIIKIKSFDPYFLVFFGQFGSRSKVSKFDVAILVEEDVVWFHISANIKYKSKCCKGLINVSSVSMAAARRQYL